MQPVHMEMLHLLATLRTYGPSPAAFIRARANDEAAHDAFDPLPEIEPAAIGPRLNALRTRGCARRDPISGEWDITTAGGAVLDVGLAELDVGLAELDGGTAEPQITDEMVERGAAAIPMDVTPHGIHARRLARDVLVAALQQKEAQ